MQFQRVIEGFNLLKEKQSYLALFAFICLSDGQAAEKRKLNGMQHPKDICPSKEIDIVKIHYTLT